MIVFGVITLIISWWLAPWIVKLLFERGAFTARNTEAVTEVFRYGLIQIPFFFLPWRWLRSWRVMGSIIDSYQW